MAGRKSEVDRVALALSKKAFIGKGPIDFEHVLYDPVNLKYFKDFCVSEMSTENLLFWLEVEDYKDIKEAAINMRLFTARKIARKYIDASATQQLGIEDRYKTAIMEGLKLPEPPPHLFTEAQQQIFVSMKTDSFPRFLESQMYKELIAIKLEDRKVVDMKDFDLYRFLGAGGFGMVLLTQMTATKKYYATKVIDKRILISQNQTHSIFREKEVLALVEHPFIVARRYAFQTEDHLCFVLDFIEGGNMYSDLCEAVPAPSSTLRSCSRPSTSTARHPVPRSEARQRALDDRRPRQARRHGRGARHRRTARSAPARPRAPRRRQGAGPVARPADDDHRHPRLPRARGVRPRLRQGGRLVERRHPDHRGSPLRTRARRTAGQVPTSTGARCRRTSRSRRRSSPSSTATRRSGSAASRRRAASPDQGTVLPH